VLQHPVGDGYDGFPEHADIDPDFQTSTHPFMVCLPSNGAGHHDFVTGTIITGSHCPSPEYKTGVAPGLSMARHACLTQLGIKPPVYFYFLNILTLPHFPSR
jgi:hypothetical protein